MKQFKIILISGLLVIGNANAKVIDETARGAISDSAMTDRKMNKSLNLHSVQKIFDNSKLTENVRTEVYRADRIYKIRLREMMDTLLILPNGEKIAAFTLGDNKNFKFVPNESNKYKLDNYTVINGVYAGADTNLLIVGETGRVYPYYVRIDSVESSYAPDFVHRIVLPEGKNEKNVSLKIEKKLAVLDSKINKEAADYLRSLPDVEAGNLSFEYSNLSGDDELSPIRVFDDGYFTYFQYSESGNIDKPRSLPVLYRVVDGFDTPVNTRIEKGMLVAETISDKWTLRSGEAHLCVRKNK